MCTTGIKYKNVSVSGNVVMRACLVCYSSINFRPGKVHKPIARLTTLWVFQCVLTSMIATCIMDACTVAIVACSKVYIQ